MTAKDNILHFDGCNTVDMVNKYGSPLLLVSESILQSKSDEIHDAFINKYKNVRAVYASKAFLNQAMCKFIKKQGLGLDVVSGGELYLAHSIDFPMDKVIFHGNNKSCEELVMAIELGVGRIVVDNHSELTLLEEICKTHKSTVSVLFRITPEVSTDTHAYIATANRDSKFGLPLETVIDVYGKAHTSSYITPMGLHFHVGSQLQSNESHLKALKVVLPLIESIHTAGYSVKELNTGGGFGVQYTDEDAEMPLSHFTKPMMEAIEKWSKNSGIERPQIIIEPGRWLIAKAGLTLYELGSSKTIPNVRKYVSVNGGIPDNIRPALYTAKYRAVVANKMGLEACERVTIAGKCCESGDILIKDIDLPELERGDLLAVLATGAYTESMSSNYNYLARPAIVFVNKGNSALIRRRESFEDMISRDIVPDHLKD